MRRLQWWSKCLLAGATCLTLTGMVVFEWASSRSWMAVPDYQTIQETHRISETSLLDRDGKVLQVLRTDFDRRQLDWLETKDISPALINSVLQTEDRRFHQHSGVDPVAILRAVWRIFLDQSHPQGASTVTMQLAGLLDPQLRPGSGRRGLEQKLRQMGYAWSLEQSWSKSQILEAYLNLVSFRGEMVGIHAASKAFFDKAPTGLNRQESALLAAMLRAPNAGRSKIAARACQLLNLSADGCEPVRTLAENALQPPYHLRRAEQLAPHVARRLLPENADGHEAIRTSLDRDLQRYVTESAARHLERLSARNVRDAAVLVLENNTGRILAYMGSSGRLSEARHVDGVRASRQAGSTLKPFIYGLAMERRFITAASRLQDSAIEIPIAAGGVYRPRNYDNVFHGEVPVRVALASSLNVPAVRAILTVGPEEVVNRMRLLGFRDLMAPEFYGASLALGSADITLEDLTNAYRTLANGGRYSGISFAPDFHPVFHPVLDPGTSFILADILADRKARALAFGLESTLATPFYAAVKTGTSKDMRDNWTVGFSDRYTVGVWAGNFSGKPMWQVSGISGAGPIWRDVMEYLHRDQASLKPLPPEGVKQVQSGNGEVEWYLAGTEPFLGKIVEREGQKPARIHYPTDGSILALDPNIPSGLQKVVFKTNLPHAQWQLAQVGKKMKPVTTYWTPVPGRYHLRLLDQAQNIQAEVAFEVR